MKNTETKTFTIYSQFLAGQLMCRGFVLCGLDRNKTDANGKNVFFFFDSPELREAVHEFSKRRNQK